MNQKEQEYNLDFSELENTVTDALFGKERFYSANLPEILKDDLLDGVIQFIVHFVVMSGLFKEAGDIN